MRLNSLALAVLTLATLTLTVWAAELPAHPGKSNIQVELRQDGAGKYRLVAKSPVPRKTSELHAFTTLRYIDVCSKDKASFAKVARFSTEPKINGKPTDSATLVEVEFQCVAGTSSEMDAQMRLIKNLCSTPEATEIRELCEKLKH